MKEESTATNSKHATLSKEVCVLIPCYNNLPGLGTSLQSIQYEEEKLFILVVDDGSQMAVSESFIQEHLPKQYAYALITLPKNEGITYALNAGLQWLGQHLEVPFVARLDCGDVCHAERFYKQVTFLRQNPDVGLLGTWCLFQDPRSTFNYIYSTPTYHEAILKEMHFRNVFIHPSIMFRKSLLKMVGPYPVEFPLVEDYALFYQMLKHQKGAILDQILVTCEINAQGLSIRNRKLQLKGRSKVVARFGTNVTLKRMGQLKLLALRMVPYQLLLHLKKRKQES